MTDHLTSNEQCMHRNRLAAMRQLAHNLRHEGHTSRADCVEELCAEVEHLMEQLEQAAVKPAEVPAWLKDREKVHLACLRGVIALNGDDALHVGGTSRNELDQLRALRAAEPPKPAHLREPPHCSTCECGMGRAAEPPSDGRLMRYELALRWLAESANPDMLTGAFAVDHARWALRGPVTKTASQGETK